MLVACGTLCWMLLVPIVTTAQFTHPGPNGSDNFVATCGDITEFYDAGGAGCDGVGSYPLEDDGSTSVICPSDAGSMITIEFLDVDIETRGTPECWDFLTIHDGNSTGAPVLFSGCGEDGFADCPVDPGDGSDGGASEGGPADINGSNSPNPANNIFTSSAGNGCLTVHFTSDESVDQGGWVAEVTCQPVVVATCDDGMQNGDETGVDCGGPDCEPCEPVMGNIPTMSEWGLIIFGLIMFTLSLVFGMSYQRTPAMAGSMRSSASQRSKFPFNQALYFKLLPYVYLAIAAIFVAAIVFTGYELTSADIPGSIIAGGILAYLVHFVLLTSKRDEE